MKKGAFTLAEVLIVLVILGIIASMTVPSLMQNTNQTVYVTGINKAFATLNNAISLASIENGESPGGGSNENANTNAQNVIDNVFAPVMKVSQKWDNAFQTQDGFLYVIDDGPMAADCGDIPQNANDVGTTTACFYVTVDVNGFAKRPNTITKNPYKDKIQDQFVLYLYRNGIAGDAAVTGPILRGDIKNKDSVDGTLPTTTAIDVKEGKCTGCGTEDKTQEEG